MSNIDDNALVAVQEAILRHKGILWVLEQVERELIEQTVDHQEDGFYWYKRHMTDVLSECLAKERQIFRDEALGRKILTA